MAVYYISGPMRGKTNYNREEFNSVEDALLNWITLYPDPDTTGTVTNPSRNFGGAVDRPVSDYMTLDLQQVLQADVIVQLPDWQESEGAYREAQLAIWAGKKFLATGRDDDGWWFTEIDAPEFTDSPRGSALDEAKQLITGDRNNAYGPPTQDFIRTANMASAYGFQVNGQPLQSHHVAVFMMLLKTSRLAWTPTKRDSWVDAAGYAGCGYECAINEEAERLNDDAS